jgi:hypothetical protein
MGRSDAGYTNPNPKRPVCFGSHSYRYAQSLNNWISLAGGRRPWNHYSATGQTSLSDDAVIEEPRPQAVAGQVTERNVPSIAGRELRTRGTRRDDSGLHLLVTHRTVHPQFPSLCKSDPLSIALPGSALATTSRMRLTGFNGCPHTGALSPAFHVRLAQLVTPTGQVHAEHSPIPHGRWRTSSRSPRRRASGRPHGMRLADVPDSAQNTAGQVRID